ncbi:MAG: M24 family metallopeptidase [Pseudomonadota bacterium]|nr:M24 family metallopeptidase [Pseudomonadota bacterium]
MTKTNIGLNLLSTVEQEILDQAYPRFSAAEISQRRNKLIAEMAEQNLDALVVAEFLFTGSAVHWLTNWPATTASIAILTPDHPVQVIIEHYNHIPHAKKMVTEAEVLWGERDPLSIASNLLKSIRPSTRRLGIIGRLTPNEQKAVAENVDTIIDFNSVYNRLRLIKSDEEMNWMRIGALFSDMALDAMVQNVKPGITERELSAKTQAAYLPYGGAHVIEFMGVTQMENPDCCVPPQFPSTRKIQSGDVLVTEITSHFWNYPGQVLRTMTISERPTPLYQELHEVAELVRTNIEKTLRPGCTAAEIFELSSVIEDAGFSIWDDLTHGYGGGYLTPVLGCASRPAGPVPDFTFEENMTLVVQPNIITKDAKAGVQTGGLVKITATGAERMQVYPNGLLSL